MRTLFSVILLVVVAEAWGSPCDQIDSSLDPNTRAALSGAMSTQLHVRRVDILKSFRCGSWTILNINTHQADPAFLFYRNDPLVSRYITLWAGAARMDEEETIKNWALQNARGIPPKLAACFAWYVTKGRTK